MPLPCIKNGSPKCQCKSKRTGLACNNPAAYGQKACRMHGAHRKFSKLIGEYHPNYQHGSDTLAAKDERSEKSLMFLMLEDLGHHAKIFHPKATRIRGRKPRGYKKLNLSDPNELVEAVKLTNPHQKNNT